MGTFLDSSFLQKQCSVPKEFIWPKGNLVSANEELKEPVLDLEGFFRGDDMATRQAAAVIRAACFSHGCFQVINHGVDPKLLAAAHDHANRFFNMPASDKLRARNMSTGNKNKWGYSGAHADRFLSNLPWKETLSFGFHDTRSDPSSVLDFFKSNLGDDFEQMGMVYQKYCEAMKGLALALTELLALSLGVDRLHFKRIFQEGASIMRCNYYPPCQNPDLTFGTGPHCDPTSLTILHQDEVGGLEVFANKTWQAVRPRQDALVIIIGETFTLGKQKAQMVFVAGQSKVDNEAMTNGKYKSCVHRAVVNNCKARRSLAFFLCPPEDEVVRPPKELVCGGVRRLYPDFTWSELLQFTQKHYRADAYTLHNFTNWLLASKPAAAIIN